MVKKKSHSAGVKETLDITDELIAERRTSLKMPKDMVPWMAKTIEFIDAKMLLTGKFKICYVTVNGGGHAILEYEGMYVDNWKRQWTLRSEYELDYAKYDWTYKHAFNPFVVITKLIMGKFWKK